MADDSDKLYIKQLQAEVAALKKLVTSAGSDAFVGARLAALESAVAGISLALNNATIEATCNPEDSTIEVTLTLPELPPPFEPPEEEEEEEE